MEWVLFLVINITLIEFGFNRKIKTTINIMGKTKQEKRILSAQETKLLLDSSKGGMMYPIFVVALGTGMRIGEILGLTWDCVDFEKEVIRVEKTVSYLPGDGKMSLAKNMKATGIKMKWTNFWSN